MIEYHMKKLVSASLILNFLTRNISGTCRIMQLMRMGVICWRATARQNSWRTAEKTTVIA